MLEKVLDENLKASLSDRTTMFVQVCTIEPMEEVTTKSKRCPFYLIFLYLFATFYIVFVTFYIVFLQLLISYFFSYCDICYLVSISVGLPTRTISSCYAIWASTGPPHGQGVRD